MKAFLKRRCARGEYLGLHLTIGLLLSLALLGFFVGIVRGIHKEHGELEQIDLAVAQQMEHHGGEHPLALDIMRVITAAGAFPALAMLTLAGALTLIGRGGRFQGIVWIIAACAGGLFDALLKLIIGRHRPLNPDSSIHALDASFPSGHAMGSLVGYGMLAYLLLIRLRHAWARVVVVAGLGAWVLAIGFSRVYLRAHFVWDVVGGFCVGTVWLAVCVSGLESIRLRRHAHARAEANATVARSVDPTGRSERQYR